MNQEIPDIFLSFDPDERKLSSGNYLFREGDCPDCLIYVRDGILEMVCNSNGAEKSDEPIPLFGRKVWGLREILMKKNFLLGARAVNDVQFLTISRSDVEEKLNSDPDFRIAMMGQLAREINSSGTNFE